MGTVKYNRGRHIDPQWIALDGLKNVLYNSISLGSTLYSDEHRSYISILRENQDLSYNSVNHSTYFVSESGVHTNTIKNLWLRF
ncbi:hypothetical protein CWI37_0515p0040 [Hamiltosporidium tvaerminnensis]|uniref:ISXO2-like transposase domain-containing protein n=1 Tax=Hamiltosporidium tvaerminnensis TaxID=1176355 RepID=A0A4Q9L455_9MICR|nr:hypothetical protein CWI37_0515p0040 [Hamiltosporidium tvaerminnensis]